MKFVISQKPGFDGIIMLKRCFKKHDYNGNGKLDVREFEEALESFGIFCKVIEM